MSRSSAPCPRCGQYFYEFTASNYCKSCLNVMKYDKQKSGGGGGNMIDSATRKFLPPIIILGLIGTFIMRYKMYVISIAAIVIVCFILCRFIFPRTRNSDRKIGVTIGLGIILIISVFFIVPKIENSPRTSAAPRNQTVQSQARYMLVNANALNIRKGPSTDYDVVGQVTKGTRVQILDSSGQWWKIKFGNIEGFVHSEYLTNERNTSSVSPPSTSRVISTSSTSSSEPGAGTTRSAQYQQEWEEAYDRAPPVLPSGLVLPGGQTVEERVRSGRVYGK